MLDAYNPALGRLRQRDCKEFKTSLVWITRQNCLKTPSLGQWSQVIRMTTKSCQEPKHAKSCEPSRKGCNKNKDSSQASEACQMAMLKPAISLTELSGPEREAI